MYTKLLINGIVHHHELTGLSLADVTREQVRIEQRPVINSEEDDGELLEEFEDVEITENVVDEAQITAALKLKFDVFELLEFADEKMRDWPVVQAAVPEGELTQIFFKAASTGFVRARVTGTTQAKMKAAVKAAPSLAGMDFTGLEVSLEAFPAARLPVATLRVQDHAAIETFATDARAKIAGTSDPAKLAEYSDKASAAPAIIADTATAAQVAEAAADAALYGLPDAKAMATVWLAKAEGLRQARQLVNTLVFDGHAAVTNYTDAEKRDQVMEALLVGANAQLEALLAGM